MTTLADSPAATQTSPAQPASFVIYDIERYECPCCESAIPQECVKREEPSGEDMQNGHRRISVYCGSCGRGFKATFRFCSGRLLQITPIDVITDREEIRRLQSRIERIRGDRRINVAVEPDTKAADRKSARKEPSASMMELLQLHGAMYRTEAQLLEMGKRERELVREAIAETRIPPATPGDPEPADLERLDSDCDVARAHIEQAMETGAELPPDHTIDPSTNQGDHVEP